MAGPLSGIKVVEFTGLGPAPLAGQLLADLGADVIAVDRKSLPADSTDVNRRGKRSIAVNLKSEAGRAAVLALLARADVLIEGFRPGVMEKLRLGPDDVPDHLVFGRMTGWGQTGPLAQTAGHDLTYLALTGTLGMFGQPGQPPHPSLNYVADYAGGTMFLLFGVMAALVARQRTGKGDVVDAAMIDGVAAMGGLMNTFMARGMVGETRGENFLDGSAPFYRSYVCADGKFVAVGCLEPQFFKEFLRLAGLPLADAKHQHDREYWPDMHARYAAHLATRDRDEWTAVFVGSDACVTPVLSLQEAREHPHMVARGIYRTIDDTLHPAPAPRFLKSVVKAPAAPGRVGADTDEILSELGYSEVQISALREDGVLT